MPGAAHLELVQGIPLLRADEQVFEAMLSGWRNQQISRNLSETTIARNEKVVRRFQAHANEYPWTWEPRALDDWITDLCSARRLSKTTIRHYQTSIRHFLVYVTDERYGWVQDCLDRFGTHPIQICFEWNTAQHLADYEGSPQRRALTRRELQTLFDYADDRVARARRLGRKGWLSAFRDATMFKVAYAWGLRRREVSRLDVHDLGINPRVPEFGDYGAVYVRFGKAPRGGAPKRRTVLTVMPWSVEVLREWVEEIRPIFPRATYVALWPTERGDRISEHAMTNRFCEYRKALGLPDALGPHCLRHSYVTHLIEDGFDPLFVQQQVGHEHASTTAIYTSVSSDYKARVLRAALDKTVTKATSAQRGGPA